MASASDAELFWGVLHMKLTATVLLLAAPLAIPHAAVPDCSGPGRWPAAMVHVHLKNAGMVTNDEIDFDKTTSVRVASEKIGKDLYRQVHRVRYTKKDGSVIEAITVSNASHQECSMSDVQVFVVARVLGGYAMRPVQE
jgi:hypothetical protein